MSGNRGPEAALRLADVDLGNYYAIMHLEIGDDQTDFVWTNSGPLAEAAYVPGFTPRALYLGDKPVGLGVWGPYYKGYTYEKPPVPGAYIIDHVMVDRRHQGQGYGRRLIELMMAEMRSKSDCQRILLSVHPTNKHAIAIYQKLGFVEIARDHDDDIVMEFNSSPT